jgi:serine/threonine protein kinase
MSTPPTKPPPALGGGLSLSAFKKPSVRLTSAPASSTIEASYELGSIIGHGGSSFVRHCTRRATGEGFAAKVIQKHELLRERRLLSELLLLRKMRHPAIVQMHDIYETDSEVYLVMELMVSAKRA